MDVLLALVERRERVVSKNESLDLVETGTERTASLRKAQRPHRVGSFEDVVAVGTEVGCLLCDVILEGRGRYLAVPSN